MRQERSRELYEYWNRIRDGRRAPSREEIEPSDIRNLLSDTFILEVSGTLRTISYRLAGTRLCAAFGRELKGYGFLGHWSEEDCFEVAKLLTHVYREFKPTVVVMRGMTERGKLVDFEMILLPLEPMADGSVRLLGIAAPEKDYYWLGSEPIVECTLRSARHIDALPTSDSALAPLAPALQSREDGFSGGETGQDGEPMHSGSRKIAHLTVHDGGKG